MLYKPLPLQRLCNSAQPKPARLFFPLTPLLHAWAFCCSQDKLLASRKLIENRPSLSSTPVSVNNAKEGTAQFTACDILRAVPVAILPFPEKRPFLMAMRSHCFGRVSTSAPIAGWQSWLAFWGPRGAWIVVWANRAGCERAKFPRIPQTSYTRSETSPASSYCLKSF